MATFTTRLGLRKPGPTPITGDDWSTADDLNANWDKIDNAIPPTVCTSSTRPSSSLFTGMLPWETDTNAFVVRTGAPAWRYMSTLTVANGAARDAISPRHDGMVVYRSDLDIIETWNGTAWARSIGNGQIGQASFLGAATITTTDTQLSPPLTVAVTSGRLYHIKSIRHEAIASGAPITSVRLRVSNSGSVAVTDTQAGDTQTEPANGAYRTMYRDWFWTATFTGTATSGLSQFVNTGTSQIDGARQRWLYVHDVTPSISI